LEPKKIADPKHYGPRLGPGYDGEPSPRYLCGWRKASRSPVCWAVPSERATLKAGRVLYREQIGLTFDTAMADFMLVH
jgi:hypothetical protein